MKLEETTISHYKYAQIIASYIDNFCKLSKHKQSIIRKKINKDLGLAFKSWCFYYIEDKHKFMLAKIKYDL